MKKILFSFAVILFAATVFAITEVQPQASKKEDWSFIQICFWFGLPTASIHSNVYGLKTGWPISSGTGNVNGAEISWTVAGTDNINGAQGAWVFTQNKNLQGIQAALVCNVNKEDLKGLQAGLVNVSGNLLGFQPGGVNVSKDMAGIQAAAITNVARGTVTGAQFSIVNVTKTLNGFQASAFNSAEKTSGFQLGLINISKSGGTQFGVANYIKDGWIPFLPFFNIKW